jgi:hypothetical protein
MPLPVGSCLFNVSITSYPCSAKKSPAILGKLEWLGAVNDGWNILAGANRE